MSPDSCHHRLTSFSYSNIFFYFDVFFQIMSVAVVTGANRGIGLAIVKQLWLSGKFSTVYLTGRNPTACNDSLQNLKSQFPSKTSTVLSTHSLDIADKESIISFTNFLRETHGGVDVLVQNAAIAFKNSATEPFAVQAKETLRINFHGTLDVVEKFYPLMKENGRVVLLSSYCSQSTQFRFQPNSWKNEIAKELYLVNQELSEDRMRHFAELFVQHAEEGTVEKHGWPVTAYGVSKLLTNCITRYQLSE
jgi:carbonyl reductase 1